VERGYIGMDLLEQLARYRESREADIAVLAGLD
jgi:hypothetical protein